MASAIYLNKSLFPFSVNTHDFTGSRPGTLSINSGDAFVGNTTDPLIISALASGLIVLVESDPGNYLAGIPAGTPSSEAIGPLLNVLSGGAASISLVSGNSQSGTAGAALASPFVVVVRDSNSNPVSGIPVTWAVILGGGMLSAASTLTNSLGQATVTLTLGNTAGSNSVTASASGASGPLTGSPVTFTATGVAGMAASISSTSGDGQTATAGTMLPSPFVVTVVDAHSNPVSGASVTWAITLGAGSLSGTTSTTNGSGQAQTTLTLDATPGSNTVTATHTGLAGSPVTFTATGT